MLKMNRPELLLNWFCHLFCLRSTIKSLRCLHPPITRPCPKCNLNTLRKTPVRYQKLTITPSRNSKLLRQYRASTMDNTTRDLPPQGTHSPTWPPTTKGHSHALLQIDKIYSTYQKIILLPTHVPSYTAGSGPLLLLLFIHGTAKTVTTCTDIQHWRAISPL